MTHIFLNLFSIKGLKSALSGINGPVFCVPRGKRVSNKQMTHSGFGGRSGLIFCYYLIIKEIPKFHFTLFSLLHIVYQ